MRAVVNSPWRTPSRVGADDARLNGTANYLNCRRRRWTSRGANMSMNRPDIAQMQTAIATSLHEHWRLFLVEGIILVVLGFAAIVIPPIATLAVHLFFACLFLISALVPPTPTFTLHPPPGFSC